MVGGGWVEQSTDLKAEAEGEGHCDSDEEVGEDRQNDPTAAAVLCTWRIYNQITHDAH